MPLPLAHFFQFPLHAVITHHPQRQISHKVPTQTNTAIYDPLLDSLFAAHNLNSSIKSVAVSVVAVQLMTKMLLLPAAAVGLLVTFAFIAIVWSTYIPASEWQTPANLCNTRNNARHDISSGIWILCASNGTHPPHSAISTC